jgi:hypothetical protein
MTARFPVGSYLLEIESPQTGATTFETHISLAAVVARAARLIQAGCNIGVWSAASLVLRRSSIAANDDAWTDALIEGRTG